MSSELLGIIGNIEFNESNAQDVNRPFPNLITTEILVFCLY